MAALAPRQLRRDLRELPPRPLQRAPGDARHVGPRRRDEPARPAGGFRGAPAPATISPGGTSVERLPPIMLVSATQPQPGGNAPGPQAYKRPTKSLPSFKGTSQHLGAVAPGVCYNCHGNMRQYQEIAGPHQICGQNGFNCTTCHDPHGQILEASRGDLCLTCHAQRADDGLAFVDPRP